MRSGLFSVIFICIFIVKFSYSRHARFKQSSHPDVHSIKAQLEASGVTNIKDVIDDKEATKIVVLIKTNGSVDKPISRKNNRYVCNPKRCNTVCQVWKYEGGVCNNDNICSCLLSAVENIVREQPHKHVKKKYKKTSPHHRTAATAKPSRKYHPSPVDVYIANQIKKKLTGNEITIEDKEYKHARKNEKVRHAFHNQKHKKRKQKSMSVPLDRYEYVVKEKKKRLKLPQQNDGMYKKTIENPLRVNPLDPYAYKQSRKIKKSSKRPKTTEPPSDVEESDNEIESDSDDEDTTPRQRSSETDNEAKSDDYPENVKEKLKELEALETSTDDDDSLDRRPFADKVEEINNVKDDIAESYVSRKKKDINQRRQPVIRSATEVNDAFVSQSTLPTMFGPEPTPPKTSLNTDRSELLRRVMAEHIPQYSLSNYGHDSSIFKYFHDFSCGKDAPI